MFPAILNLPNELLYYIAENLSHPKDIASLILSNRRLATALTPYFHKLALEDKDGTTALHWAAGIGDESVVQLALDTGHSVVSRDQHGRTPLHHAAYRGHEIIILMLLAHGADINAQDENGETPLHCSAVGRQIPAIETLIDCGADPNAKEKGGYTTLDRAMQGRQKISMEVVKVLVDRGGYWTIRDGRNGDRW